MKKKGYRQSLQRPRSPSPAATQEEGTVLHRFPGTRADGGDGRDIVEPVD